MDEAMRDGRPTPVSDEIERSIPNADGPGQVSDQFRRGMEIAVRIARAFERASPPREALREALNEAADALWRAGNMLSAICETEPTADRKRAAQRAFDASNAAHDAPASPPAPAEPANGEGVWPVLRRKRIGAEAFDLCATSDLLGGGLTEEQAGAVCAAVRRAYYATMPPEALPHPAPASPSPSSAPDPRDEDAAQIAKEASDEQIRRVVTALASGRPMCRCRDPKHGDRFLPATCVGAYEAPENLDFGCEECCSHGNEDGWCVPILAGAAPEGGDKP